MIPHCLFKHDSDNYVLVAKPTNLLSIKPKKKKLKKDSIAYFPASTLHLPNMLEPFLTDRKLGGRMPNEYIPSYQKKSET